MKTLRNVLPVLGVLGVLVLAVVGLAFAALLGGWIGVLVFTIYVGCMLWSLGDWYASRLRRKHSRRVAPSLRAECLGAASHDGAN